MIALLASCSAEGLAPPADIDGSVRVGSIAQPQSRNGGVADRSGYAMASAPVQDYPVPVAAGPPAVSEPALASQIPEDGINMDAGLGVEPVMGLAAAQHMEIAEGASSYPVVDGIGSDAPALRAPVSPMPVQSAMPPAGATQQVAMLMPRNPATQPPPGMSPPPEVPGMRSVMPASEASCRAELRQMGVSFRDIAAISNGPSCGIAYPVELSGLSGGVAVKPAIKLNCQVTLAFAKWVKYELVPSSRFRYMSGVGRITPMGGYSCRKMNSRSNNPWSEHARGNAIDIGKITLKNGKEIDVRQKSFFAFREKGLLKAVRSDSCKYFSTVLGPGSDPDHWNHFHFDLRTRKTGYRHCD